MNDCTEREGVLDAIPGHLLYMGRLLIWYSKQLGQLRARLSRVTVLTPYYQFGVTSRMYEIIRYLFAIEISTKHYHSQKYGCCISHCSERRQRQVSEVSEDSNRTVYVTRFSVTCERNW